MQLIKKIITIIILIILLSTSLCSNRVLADGGPTAAQQAAGSAVASAAINYMNKYGAETQYSYSPSLRGPTIFDRQKVNGSYWIDCAGFALIAVREGINIHKYYPEYYDRRGGSYVAFDPTVSDAAPDSSRIDPPFERLNATSINDLYPGDMIMIKHNYNRYGHVMICTGNGDIIHCDGHGRDRGKGAISWETFQSYMDREGRPFGDYHYYRLSDEFCQKLDDSDLTPSVVDEVKEKIEEILSNWIYKKVPFRRVSRVEEGKNFEYQGIGKVESKKTTEAKGFWDKVVDGVKWAWAKLSSLLQWILNLIITVIKGIFVGFGTIVQVLVSYYMDAASGIDVSDRMADGMMAYLQNGGLQKDVANSVTLEKIVYNQVPLLDINVFNGNVAGGQTLDSSSLVVIIRNTVAGFYKILRTSSLIGMLMALIYYGVKFASTGIAEAKAEYKQKLASWAIGFIIIFGLHYFLLAVMRVNEITVGLLKQIGTNVASSVSRRKIF